MERRGTRPPDSAGPERISAQPFHSCRTKGHLVTRTSVQWPQRTLASTPVGSGSHKDRSFGSSGLWGHYGCRALISEVPMVTSGPGVYSVMTPEFTLFLWHSPQPLEHRQTLLGLKFCILSPSGSQNPSCDQGFDSIWSPWCWMSSPLVLMGHSQDRITSLTHLIVNTKFHQSSRMSYRNQSIPIGAEEEEVKTNPLQQICKTWQRTQKIWHNYHPWLIINWSIPLEGIPKLQR